MVCDTTYLVFLNCLTLYFMSILKVEKMQKALSCQFQHIYDQEENCHIPFWRQYFKMDTKNKRLNNIF